MHNLELKSSPYNILTLYSTELITGMIREYNESPDSICFGLNWELLGQLGQGKRCHLFRNKCVYNWGLLSQVGHCEEYAVPRCTPWGLVETFLSTLKIEGAYFS